MILAITGVKTQWRSYSRTWGEGGGGSRRPAYNSLIKYIQEVVCDFLVHGLGTTPHPMGWIRGGGGGGGDAHFSVGKSLLS